MWWVRSIINGEMKMDWKERLFIVGVFATIILTIILAAIPALLACLAVGIEWVLYKAGLLKERWLNNTLDSTIGESQYEVEKREGRLTYAGHRRRD